MSESTREGAPLGLVNREGFVGDVKARGHLEHSNEKIFFDSWTCWGEWCGGGGINRTIT